MNFSKEDENMKKEYDKNFYVVKAEDVEKHFDDNGFS